VSQVTFKHEMHAAVWVKEIRQAGTVVGVTLDGDGEMYKVVYWFEGQRKVEWLFGWELEARP